MRQILSKEEIGEKLRSIKGIILDGDGVWFTGQEFRGVLPTKEAIIIKSRHHHDGQGLSFLRALGLHVLFATAEGEPMTSVVTKLNNLPSVKNGDWKPITALTDLQKKGTKVESVDDWLLKNRLSWDDCAYIGDDRTDWECMLKVGLAATPHNGQRFIKPIADIVLTKDGGAGAVRGFSEMVLDARGIKEWDLPAA